MEYVTIFILVGIYMTVQVISGLTLKAALEEKGHPAALFGCFSIPFNIAVPVYIAYLLSLSSATIFPVAILMFFFGEYSTAFRTWASEGRFDLKYKNETK